MKAKKASPAPKKTMKAKKARKKAVKVSKPMKAGDCFKPENLNSELAEALEYWKNH